METSQSLSSALQELDHLENTLKTAEILLQSSSLITPEASNKNNQSFLAVSDAHINLFEEFQVKMTKKLENDNYHASEVNSSLKKENERLSSLLQSKITKGLSALIASQRKQDLNGQDLFGKIGEIALEIMQTEKEIQNLQSESDLIDSQNNQTTKEISKNKRALEFVSKAIVPSIEKVEGFMTTQQTPMKNKQELKAEIEFFVRNVEDLKREKALLEEETEKKVKNIEKKLRQKSVEEDLLRIDYQNALTSNFFTSFEGQSDQKERNSQSHEGLKEKNNQKTREFQKGKTFDSLVEEEQKKKLKRRNPFKTTKEKEKKQSKTTQRVKRNEEFYEESLMLNLDLF